MSGRPVEFLSRALDVGHGRSPLAVYGLYGAEHLAADGTVHRTAADAANQELLALAAEELRAELPAHVTVEPKGVSCVVHWRTAPRLAAVALEHARAAAERHGLDLRPGKMAAELAAPGAVDKGDVVRALAGQAEATCFIGDDVGDIPAFHALHELARTHGSRTWRLAVLGPESPDELLAHADATLAGPPATSAFLTRLVESLDSIH